MAVARKWFLLGLAFGSLFLIFTALYWIRALDMATLTVERWMIGRPLLQFDCVLVEWNNFGAAPVTLVFMALLGTVCGFTRYSWHILPCLLLLAMIGIGAEVIGKTLVTLPYPPVLTSGMVALTCPQAGSSPLQHLQLGLGMWWKAPLPSQNIADWPLTVSRMPINISSGHLAYKYSYPSGHAIRWWFTGLLMTWLFWRHSKRAVTSWLFVVLTLTLCFLGAAIPFYIGTHFLSDILAGYLLGAALACFAIGLLLLNEKKNDGEHFRYASPPSLPQQNSSGEVPTTKVFRKKKR